MTRSTVALALNRPERAVRDAFEAAGATSAATARPLAELPGFDADYLATLVDRGLVREGPPGRFYFYAHTRRPARRRTLRWVLIALVILLGPILLVQFTTPR